MGITRESTTTPVRGIIPYYILSKIKPEEKVNPSGGKHHIYYFYKALKNCLSSLRPATHQDQSSIHQQPHKVPKTAAQNTFLPRDNLRKKSTKPKQNNSEV